MYDLIGDIHGHADELVQLLDTLGYKKSRGVYGHPERKVIFLGDFIDRGPKIRQALEIVRPMIEKGKALAVMGNHELNALAYHTEDPEKPGEFLRRHEEKNVRQHHKTIEQLKPDELVTYLKWFRTLPLWLELDGLRVVHACWDERAIRTIRRTRDGKQEITDAFLNSSCKKGNDLFAPVEVVLKGKEAKLPNGGSFLDPDGTVRHEIRTKWFLSPTKTDTYGSYALQSAPIQCDIKLEKSLIEKAVPYPTTAKPVFVGHYGLSAHRPEILAENVACLDFSVAKGGFLCAYRWQGEQKLSNDNFVWVSGGETAKTVRSENQPLPTVQPGRYRHYKGKQYTVIGVALHSETQEELVVYRQEYGNHGLWVRPKEMFVETVNVEGHAAPRFQYVGSQNEAFDANSATKEMRKVK